MISCEVVGQTGLGVDTTSGPDEFIKTVFPPAVYSTNLVEAGFIRIVIRVLLLILTNLYGSDGSVEASALQVEKDNIWSVGSLFAVVCHSLVMAR